jgi:hypothetical protein
MKAHQLGLLLADAIMPTLDGIALGICVKRAYPDCSVLLFSAIGGDSQLTERITKSGFDLALESKPLQICRLLDRITGILSASH